VRAMPKDLVGKKKIDEKITEIIEILSFNRGWFISSPRSQKKITIELSRMKI